MCGQPSALRRLCIGMLIGLCAAPLPAFADTLLLKDGRTFTGRLVRSDDKVIVFEVRKLGSKASVTFPREQVVRIALSTEASTKPASAPAPATKPTYTGPTYAIVPMAGSIGLEITDPVLKKCLAVAEAQKPTAVLLVIDSNGGTVAELRRIVRTLESYMTQHRDIRVVAYVKRAGAGAALLAFACAEVVVAPSGFVGGAVIYRRTTGGVPDNVSEKTQSLHRAELRAHAEKVGHSPLLVDGMMRADLVLGLAKDTDGVRIVEGDGDRILKPKGKILSLSARDAVACGLALGIADTPESSNTVLQIKEWRLVAAGAVARPFADWNRKLQAAAREHRTLILETGNLLDEAVAKSPEEFKYETLENSSKLTAASGQKWKERRRVCFQLLSKVEAKLARLAVISEQYPQLIEFEVIKPPLDHIEKLNRGIASLKKKIERDAEWRGILPER